MLIIIGDKCVEDVSLLTFFEALLLNLKQNFKGRIFFVYVISAMCSSVWVVVKDKRRQEGGTLSVFKRESFSSAWNHQTTRQVVWNPPD